MRLHCSALALLLASSCLIAAPALAAPGVPSLPTAGGFSVTPNVGTDFTVGGDFVKSGSDSITGSGTFGGVTVTGTGTLSVGSQKFNDVYNTPIQLGISANYGLSDYDEVSLTPRWFHAEGKNFDAATASFTGTINGVAVSGSAPIQGQFSNYNEYGADAGYKHFFNTPLSASFHPYLGAMLGVEYNNSVSVNLSSNGTPIANNVGFYSSGWTWDTGLQAGFRFDVAPAVAIGLETGIRYTGDLKSDHSALTGAGGNIDSVNSAGNRWDIPLLFGVTVKF
jgi:hypothetical protein